MSENNTPRATGGISVLGLLGVMFIGLKLTNAIAWSWWLVLLPFYGPAAFVLVFMILFAIIAALAG